MALPAVFTEEFSAELEETVKYLAENWSNNVKTDFLASLADAVRRIEAMQEMYPVSPQNPTIRRCVINNRIAVFYRIKNDCVEMLSLRSTRRNDTL